MLLPDAPAEDRDALIDEAHRAILEEEVLPEGHGELREGFVRAMVSAVALQAGAAQGGARRPPRPPAVEEVLRQLAASPPDNAALNSVLESCVAPEGLLLYFKGQEGDGGQRDGGRGFEVDRSLDTETMVKMKARTTAVFGRILEALSEKHSLNGTKGATWVTRLGRVFWGLVEVAVPGSFRNRLFRHWVKLPYLLSALLLVLGTLLLNGQMQLFAVVTLALTACGHFGLTLRGGYMRTGESPFRRPALGLLRGALIVSLLLLAALGGYELYLKAAGFDGAASLLKLWRWLANLPGLSGPMLVVALLGGLAFLAAVAYGSARELGKAM